MTASSSITVLSVLDAIQAGSTDSIVSAYVAADVSGKAAIRRTVTAVRDAAIDRLDMDVTSAAKNLLVSLSTKPSAKSETDVLGDYADFVGSVVAFADSVLSGAFVPAAFAELPETDKSLIRDTTDLPVNQDVTDKLRNLRISSGTRRSGGSIPNHIEQVFSDLPVGTFLTYTETANRTSDAYGTDHPSAGAVAACAAADKAPAVVSVSSALRGSREVAGFVRV